MNINLILVVLQTIGHFLMSNIPAILFLIGLAFIVYAVFLLSVTAGYIAIGVSLIIIALILVKESQEGSQ